MFGFLRPSPTLTNAEVRSSLRMMVLEGITSEALATIQVMGFLAAYALALGANNLQVGIVSAVPFAALVVQLPAILLIERFRVRKAIGLPAWVIAQLFMIPIGAVPFFVGAPGPVAVTTLIVLLGIRGIFAPLWITSWMSWMHDLVPPRLLGRLLRQTTGGVDGHGGCAWAGSELRHQLVAGPGWRGAGGLRLLHLLHCRSAYPRAHWPGDGREGEGAADAGHGGVEPLPNRHSDGAVA